MFVANGINEQLTSESFGEELKKIYDKVLWMYVEDLNNTLSKAASANAFVNAPTAPESQDNKDSAPNATQ